MISETVKSLFTKKGILEEKFAKILCFFEKGLLECSCLTHFPIIRNFFFFFCKDILVELRTFQYPLPACDLKITKNNYIRRSPWRN